MYVCVVQITKTYKYKLKLSKDQERILTEWIYTCRAVYNLALETKRYAYDTQQITLSCYDLQKQLTECRQEFDWIKAVPSQSLQDVNERLDKGYKAYFRKLKSGEIAHDKQVYIAKRIAKGDEISLRKLKDFGKPKFARKDNYNSITLKKVSLVSSGIFKLPKIGTVSIFKDREPEGKLLRATITKEINGFFISIVTRQEIQPPIQITPVDDSQVVGVDMGVELFAVTSEDEENGEDFIDNPSFTSTYAKKLRLEQRSLSRKVKGSNNWYKQKRKVAKIYDKIKCSRNDFLHKESTELLSRYQIAVAEDLKLKNMTKSAKGNADNHGKNVKQKSGLNRSLLDVGIGRYFEYLDYKSKWQGKEFIQVNPAYTSQTCSCCSHVSKNNRKSRSLFVCENC